MRASTHVTFWLLAAAAPAQTLVMDINPGRASTNLGSAMTDPAVLNGVAYFGANDGVTGAELWRSDGTVAGTYELKDINKGSGSSSPMRFVTYNGEVYFVASEPASGAELWKTDGTGLGTVLVRDIQNGPSSSSPWNFTVARGLLFFSATTTASGRELWVSNGMSAGTYQVRDIGPGAANGTEGNTRWADLAGKYLAFRADDGVHGHELWFSDGTSQGTFMIEVNATGGSDPDHCLAIGNTLYFGATDGITGRELWKSGASAISTTRVADLNPGPGDAWPSLLVNANGTLHFFTFVQPITGNVYTLYRSDGSSAGTTPLKTFTPPTMTASVSNLTYHAGSVYFCYESGGT